MKGSKKTKQPYITITDETLGFRIQATIHPNTENPCEVWVYDEKERFPRVRMIGGSMLHTMNAATSEAIKRYEKHLETI